ncbi:MAG: HupE/UreJ family protein [Hyphomicrobiaceae bacterium]|nr:HupE/UreJ family protein [Hyphomicrobiaceae bacterium]
MARWFKIVGVTAAITGLCVSSAFAHHLMGGQLPNTSWQGLLSGLGHPVIGVDHFAFVLGVGRISHLAGRMALLPLLFAAGTVLGCFVDVPGSNVPWVQPLLALTVAAAAAVVGRVRRRRSACLPLCSSWPADFTAMPTARALSVRAGDRLSSTSLALASFSGSSPWRAALRCARSLRGTMLASRGPRGSPAPGLGYSPRWP